MIVLDSSFLIAFYNESDAHHRTASALMRRFLAAEWGKGLLLEYVFLEVVTVLMLRLDLSAAIHVGRILLDAEELDFVPCSDLFLETLDCFSRQTRHSPQLRRRSPRPRGANPRRRPNPDLRPRIP